jgi:RNA polymerase sigma-70 factor (ECF subfamily)
MSDSGLTIAGSWRRCVANPSSDAAWESLLQNHSKTFAAISVRVAARFGGSSKAELDDAMQVACIKLSEQARSGQVPAGDDRVTEAYLKAVVANCVHDHFRKMRSQIRDQTKALPLEEGLIAAEGSMDRALLISELENFVGPGAREKLLFHLYYREGWSAQEIAGIPTLQLSVKGVETAIGRVVAAIRQKLKVKRPVEE